MINVIDRQTHTLHHTLSKVRIKRYTQTHIILLVLSIIIAIMPRMTRRWTFCWHKGGVSAAALDRTHNFEVQENHNGCWNTPITLNIINQLEGSNPWTKVNNNNNTMVVEIHPSPSSTTLKGIMTTGKKHRQPHLHQIGCTTAIFIFTTLVSSTNFYSSISLVVAYQYTTVNCSTKRMWTNKICPTKKRDDISVSIVSY